MNISFLKNFSNILFFTLIIISFQKIKNEKPKYNYSSILNHEPKITLDFIFDENYKENSESFTSKSNTFDKYFFTYYETELPLVNGAKMACYIPNKKHLLTLEEKENQNENENKSLIYNISLDYGYIFLKEVNNYCFNSLIERWYYKVCPSKTAIQTLSYNKIDEKTGKEVLEVNYLGFGMNYTNLTNEYDLYKKETGINIKKEKEIELKNVIAINDKVIKIYDKQLLNMYTKNIKNILIITYKISDLKLSKNKNEIKINQAYSNIDIYSQKNPSFKSVDLQREILKKLNKNTFLLDEPLPKDVKYMTMKLINKNIVSDKKYNEDIFVYKNVLFCKTCNFPKCEYNQCFISSSTSDIKKVIQILDQNLVLLNDNYNNIIDNTKFALWYGNDIKITFGKGVITNILSGKFDGSFAFDSKLFKPGDYILLLKKETKQRKKKETKLIAFKNIFNNTKYIICEIVRIEISFVIVNPSCIQNSNDVDLLKGYFIVSKMNLEFKLKPISGFIDPLHKISKLNANNLNKISIPFTRDTIYTYETSSPNQFDVHFTLTSIHKIKSSYISIYLTSKKDEINENDYEIIFNSKSGILIKTISNDKLISFYTNERMNLFTTKLECDIILVNSTIYVNTLDNEYEKLSSIKVKYKLNSSNSNINYIKLNEKESSNIKFHNIYYNDKILNEHKINIFLHEKKYSLADNATFIDYFEGGDYCEAIKSNRKVKLIYSCDPTGINSIVIKDVKEDQKKLCEYIYYVQSKFLCNPNTIMKNVIKSADNPVNCIPKNDIYNHNSDEFFK